MPGSGPGQHDELAFLPERVARKSFTASFRGFDQLEVKAYLGELATELRSLREREEQLRQELIDARLIAERAQQIDESKLTSILGEETAKVLDTARQAAAQITTKAQERGARVLREAQDDATRIRAGAEMEINKRVADREAELTAARAELEARRKEIEDQATREIVAARERGREMVAEAQLVRERVLKDMVRRRRIARQQIEQLRAARERLLGAYALVRRTLDEATEELAVAMPEAKLAAELAGRRFAESNPEVELTLADLEAEVAAAEDEIEELGEEPASPGSPASAAGAPPPEALDASQWFDPPASGAPEQAERPPPEDATAGEPDPQPVGPVEAEMVEEHPPVADEPVHQAGGDDDNTLVEERRSSTLRIFRRRPTAPEPRHRLVQGGPSDPVEGVRIIRSEEPPEPEPVFVPSEAPEAETAAVEPEPVPADALADVPDEPAAAEVADVPSAPEPEPEPAAAAEVAVDSAPEPEAEPVAAAEVAATADADAEPGPESEAKPVAARIDELFARMRAERAEAVAKAQQVLAEPDARPETAVDQPRPEDDAHDDEPAAAPVPSFAAGVLATRDDAVAPIEQALTRRLKRVLADEQNEVLDLLRRAPSSPRAGDLLPAPADHVLRYRDAAAEALQAAWRAGAGGDRGAVPDELLTELGTELVEPLRARVERAVGEASDGEELGDALRAAYREWRTKLTDGTVRHVVVAAYSAGVYDAAPAGTKLCWVVDNGGVPCPDADDNALAGSVEKGEPFPTGHLRPPAHAGCRCLAVPAPD